MLEKVSSREEVVEAKDRVESERLQVQLESEHG